MVAEMKRLRAENARLTIAIDGLLSKYDTMNIDGPALYKDLLEIKLPPLSARRDLASNIAEDR